MAGSGTAHLRDGDNVLRVEHLVVEFPGRRGRVVHAVSDVSFDLSRGETLGLVGESGCGKSTTGRAVMRLEDPTSGRVLLDETDLCALDGIELRKAAKNLQMIFQDSVSSLNPRRRVRDIVREGLDIWVTTQTVLPMSGCTTSCIRSASTRRPPEAAVPTSSPADSASASVLHGRS